MSDAPLVECPSCGKATLSKLVSAAGFQLKGSGWYVTDFRDGNKGKKGEGDSKSKDAAANSDAGASANSDSGAASKADKSAGSSATGKKGEANSSESPKTEAKGGKQSGSTDQ